MVCKVGALGKLYHLCGKCLFNWNEDGAAACFSSPERLAYLIEEKRLVLEIIIDNPGIPEPGKAIASG